MVTGKTSFARRPFVCQKTFRLPEDLSDMCIKANLNDYRKMGDGIYQ
jgi:hypothetical protein